MFDTVSNLNGCQTLTLPLVQELLLLALQANQVPFDTGKEICIGGVHSVNCVYMNVLM